MGSYTGDDSRGLTSSRLFFSSSPEKLVGATQTHFGGLTGMAYIGGAGLQGLGARPLTDSGPGMKLDW